MSVVGAKRESSWYLALQLLYVVTRAGCRGDARENGVTGNGCCYGRCCAQEKMEERKWVVLESGLVCKRPEVGYRLPLTREVNLVGRDWRPAAEFAGLHFLSISLYRV